MLTFGKAQSKVMGSPKWQMWTNGGTRGKSQMIPGIIYWGSWISGKRKLQLLRNFSQESQPFDSAISRKMIHHHHTWLYFLVELHRWAKEDLAVCVSVGVCVYLSWAETQRFQWAAGHRGQCTVGRCDEGGNERQAMPTVCDSLEKRDRRRENGGVKEET